MTKQISLFFFLILLFFSLIFSATGSPALAWQSETPTASTGMFITVITDEPQINIRMGPSSTVYPVVGTLLTGSVVPALGRSPGGDWIQIEFPGAPGGVGWVYSPLVQVSPGILRVVEPPPTPIPPATATIDPTLAAQFTIIPTTTRMPTFTPAPARTLPAYTHAPTLNSSAPAPMAVIIIALATIGILVFLVSLLPRKF